MKLVYLGTPELAVPTLEALVAAGHEVVLVVSRPDRRRGRGGNLSPSPVKKTAIELGIPVSHDVRDVVGTEAELGVVVAFGEIIKPEILAEIPMVNLHFSLLPRWRGAAPVERAILEGDTVTGVCLIDVANELDAGDVYRVAEVPISNDIGLEELRSELVEVGTELLVDALEDGLGEAEPQAEGAVYAAKIDSDLRRLDLSVPAVVLHRVVRLGGAWLDFRGRRLRVLKAEVAQDAPPEGTIDNGILGTSDGGLKLIEVQPEAKRPMSASDWLNGARPNKGETIG